MVSKEVKTEIEALSPTEQKVYSQLYSQRVINTEDVKGILGDSHKSPDYITNLREKGYLQKIRKGLYAIVPPNLVGKKYHPDKFLVAGKVKENYYLSYHSALELYGLAQSAYNTVWITTKSQANSFTYQSINYQFLTTKYFFGITRINHQGVDIQVSDREKTFLDCLRHPKYAGGWEELMKSLNTLPSLNWNKFTDYVEKFDKKSLYQKSGFLLENLGIKTPDKVFTKLKSRVGNRTYYLEKDKESSLNRKWNLMIPKNFQELMQGA